MDRAENEGFYRANLHIGQKVAIIKKADQRTGKLTEGFIQRILTKSAKHTRGIKVMLDTGEVGRVQHIISE